MLTKRVLFIDDEPGIRSIVQISLRAIAAWEVLTAASGSEGLMIAQAEQPDAVLLDMMMPDMDGIATLEHFRQNAEIQHIPIVLLTAKQPQNESISFYKLAISGVIAKPFKAPELVIQMRSLLGWND